MRFSSGKKMYYHKRKCLTTSQTPPTTKRLFSRMLSVKRTLWIGTADIEDIYFHYKENNN